MIILIILIILVLLSFNLFRNLFKNDATILDDVKLKGEDPSNNGFALMLEQEDGTYEESNSSSWPTDMKFNSELSGCIDINGNIIEDALEYDSANNIMNVSVGETAYCYVYFDIKRYCNKNETLGECLLRKNSEIDSLNDNIEGGLYRYQGTNDVVNDNYVCFGTTDKTTCTGSPSTYMYRIIGINSNYQLKLLNYYSHRQGRWHSDNETNTSWPESDLFKALNGIDDSNWYNKIATVNLKYGDVGSNGDYSGLTIYTIENSWVDELNAKIGLMYIHDYYYAYAPGGNPGSNSNAKTAWLHSSTAEWTMTRYGYYSNYSVYSAWCLGNSGAVGVAAWLGVENSYFIRPVFFLQKTVEYLGGTGISDDPFIIKN